MPGLIAGVAHIPPEADLWLMGSDSVPVAIYGGEARCYPDGTSEIVMSVERVRQSLDLKITHGEFYAWLMLHGTKKFLIEGVPIATGGYAGARGTAFDMGGPRALTLLERAAIESGSEAEIPASEFVTRMLDVLVDWRPSPQ